MQKFIFNAKYLSDKLKHMKIEEIQNYEEHLKTLKKWNYSLVNSNLAKTKEVSIQGDFLSQIFTKILGYKGRIGEKSWNLVVEKKTEVDSTVADGALGFYSDTVSDTRVVIELKDAATDLDRKQKREKSQSPVEQAFNYQIKHRDCRWVIVSNFKEIRLYNSKTMTEYEQFFVESLATDEEQFKKFYYLLSKNNLIDRLSNSIIDDLYISNEAEEEKITDEFYGHYKRVRIELHNHLVNNNRGIDEILLLEKTQKILDRFIFICFCEDSKLLPDKIFRKVIEAAKNSFEMSETKIWDQLKGLFKSIDKGNPAMDIKCFNGGLFKKDVVLDNLIIHDEIFALFERVAVYDFESELDVNLLGHIFEQSISDIEEIKSEIQGKDFDKNKSKRKCDGVFYTPSFVTNLIVEKTIGDWLMQKRVELGEERLPILTEKDFEEYTEKQVNKRIKKITSVEAHIDFYKKFQDILRNIKVLDPACGSGAFLNAAFDYLFKEGKGVNEELSRLTRGQIELFELDKHILKHNLYGVDLNRESVEITKLSLWIKTANKNDPLTSLDENIQWGNSLINNPGIETTCFNWEEAFPKIFKEGGFDIILGNPPYIRVQLLNSKAVDFMFDSYEFATGKLDISILFFEKAMSMLSKDGRAGFISTSQWMQTDYGMNIRKFFSKGHMTEIIDFGSLPIFGDADTYPAIFIFQSKKKNTISYTKVDSLDKVNFQDIKPRIISYDLIDHNPWNFSGFDLKKHLENKAVDFNMLSYYGDPLIGCLTGMDKVFVVSKEQVKELQLEEDIIYPYAYRGDEVEQFKRVTPNMYVIYPYTLGDKNMPILIEEKVMESNYPNIYSYLLQYKEDLRLRKDSRRLYADVEWYRLLRPGNFQHVFSQKILCKGIDTTVKCGILAEKTIFNGANCPGIILNNKISFYYLVGLLNSELVTRYLNPIVPKKLGGYFRYNATNIKKIPIVVPKDKSITNLIEHNVKDMIKCKEKEQVLRDRFKRRLEDNFGTLKWTRKLVTFELLSFKELLEELKKQNINLHLSQQDEWEDYFYEIQCDFREERSICDENVKSLNYLIEKIYQIDKYI